MKALKAPFRIGAMVVAVALVVPACVATDADEPTSEERDPSTDKKDASRGRDPGGKTSDGGRVDGGRTDAGADRGSRSRDAGRTVPDARTPVERPDPDEMDPEGDDDAPDDDAPNEPEDDDDQGGDEPSEDGSTPEAPSDAGAQGGQGEVIVTDGGGKIYVDPSCPNMMPMLGSRMIELVGCCIEGMNKCGLSTHKLMIPAQFAAMFPTTCRGYEELSMFMLPVPEEKACTISE